MEALGRAVPQTLLELLDRMRIDAVVGAPQVRGNVTVIPVGELSARLGYGFGGGEAPSRPDEEGDKTSDSGELEAEGAETAPPAAQPTASGGGGGGGGMGSVQPRGFIELSESGARWVPIQDERRTARAGILLAGWVLFWLLYTVRTIAGARAQRER